MDAARLSVFFGQIVSHMAMMLRTGPLALREGPLATWLLIWAIYDSRWEYAVLSELMNWPALKMEP